MINTQFDIIGVGNPLLDVLARVPESFLAQIDGEKGGMLHTGPDTLQAIIQTLPHGMTRSPGGSAGNTTFALARLGLRTAFIGKVGRDDQGDFYRKAFRDLGGDDARFKFADVPTGQCLSLITPDSQRTLRTDLGAAATLAPSELTTADFLGASHAHFEGYLLFNPDLMRAGLRAAKAANCTTSLDLASFEVVNASKDFLPDLLRDYVDIVFANEDEAAAFCGPDRSFPEMARQLNTLVPTAAVKVGKQGAWIAQHNADPFHVPALPNVTAIDTTGAGDLWAAGFLFGWRSGWPIQQSAELAAKLGAAVVQVIGSTIPDPLWHSATTH